MFLAAMHDVLASPHPMLVSDILNSCKNYVPPPLVLLLYKRLSLSGACHQAGQPHLVWVSWSRIGIEG